MSGKIPVLACVGGKEKSGTGTCTDECTCVRCCTAWDDVGQVVLDTGWAAILRVSAQYGTSEISSTV